MKSDRGGSKSDFSALPLISDLILNELLRCRFKLFKCLFKYLFEIIKCVEADCKLLWVEDSQ